MVLDSPALNDYKLHFGSTKTLCNQTVLWCRFTRGWEGLTKLLGKCLQRLRVIIIHRVPAAPMGIDICQSPSEMDRICCRCSHEVSVPSGPPTGKPIRYGKPNGMTKNTSSKYSSLVDIHFERLLAPAPPGSQLLQVQLPFRASVSQVKVDAPCMEVTIRIQSGKPNNFICWSLCYLQ